MANGEVETLDERRVQVLGILRLHQRVLQLRRAPDLHPPLDSDDPTVPTRLDHLPVDARGTDEALDHRAVGFEAIGRNQRDSNQASTAITSLRTTEVLREDRRPTRLLAHTREATSMVAKSHVGLRLLPMNV